MENVSVGRRENHQIGLDLQIQRCDADAWRAICVAVGVSKSARVSVSTTHRIVCEETSTAISCEFFSFFFLSSLQSGRFIFACSNRQTNRDCYTCRWPNKLRQKKRERTKCAPLTKKTNETQVVKGEIPWSSSIIAVSKNATSFTIQVRIFAEKREKEFRSQFSSKVPDRKYVLQDKDNHDAEGWVKAIEQLKVGVSRKDKTCAAFIAVFFFCDRHFFLIRDKKKID